MINQKRLSSIPHSDVTFIALQEIQKRSMQTLHGPRKALKVEVCQAPVAGHQAFAQVLAFPRFDKLLITRIKLCYICHSLRRVKLASFHPSANLFVEMRQCVFCK